MNGISLIKQVLGWLRINEGRKMTEFS